jgi:hypothetical protein
MSFTTYSLRARIRHDADELSRLADWLRVLNDTLPQTEPTDERASIADGIALDYFRLAARLEVLTADARDCGVMLTRPLP